jgi:hypothetical protein
MKSMGIDRSGLRTLTKPVKVTTSANGDATIYEATPGLAVPPIPADLHPSDMPCAFERWDRSSSHTDADLNVLWGDAALYWVARMRTLRAAVTVVDNHAVRLQAGQEEGLLVPLGDPDRPLLAAVTSQAGTLPTPADLTRSLLRPAS